MTYNLIGFKTRNLTVVEKLAEKTSSGRTQWKCLCFCGNYTVQPTYALTTINGPGSCGRCEWHIKHKEAYTSWMAMKQRCNDPTRKDYKYYGGRGISYDVRWESFVDFYKDMGDPPKDPYTGERLSLDREDVNGNYCKNNCKWSDRSEQQLNKTNSFVNVQAESYKQEKLV